MRKRVFLIVFAAEAAIVAAFVGLGTQLVRPKILRFQSWPASLSGIWLNEHSITLGITRLEIVPEAARVRVHAWAKCDPIDCDWGVQEGGVQDGVATVTWHWSSRNRTEMALSVAISGRLRCVTVDESSTWEAFFRKGS